MVINVDWYELEGLTSRLVKLNKAQRRAELQRLHQALDRRIQAGGGDALEARIERAYLYGVEDTLREE